MVEVEDQNILRTEMLDPSPHEPGVLPRWLKEQGTNVVIAGGMDQRVMDDVCIGCSRCLVSFNRREGKFSRYRNMDAEIIGLLNCGDCPGAGIVPRLAEVTLWNKPMDEKITKVHVATCLVDHCPYKETIINKIKAKAGVEVIIGNHPYIPENMFA